MTIWRELIENLGYLDQASTLNRLEILNCGRQYCPETVEKVEARFLERGQVILWDVIPPRWLLKELFGIECVIDAEGKGTGYYAFGTTNEPQEVKLLTDLYCSLIEPLSQFGISKLAIVLVISQQSNSIEEYEYAVDETLSIVMAVAEQSAIITKHILTIC